MIQFVAHYESEKLIECVNIPNFACLPDGIKKLDVVWWTGKRFSISAADRYFYAREVLATFGTNGDFVAVIVGGKWRDRWHFWRCGINGSISTLTFLVDEKWTKSGKI